LKAIGNQLKRQQMSMLCCTRDFNLFGERQDGRWGSGVNPSGGGEAINGRASKPETRSGEDRVGLPKAAPEGRALREQASSNLKDEI